MLINTDLLRAHFVLRRSSSLIILLGVLSFNLLPQTSPLASAAEQAPSETNRCISEHSQSQRLRRDTDFMTSRQLLIQCADENCPSLVRDDCTAWLNELEARIPSIVLSGKEAGNDVPISSVYIDGHLINYVAGVSHQLNPGTHEITATDSQDRKSTKTVTIIEGQKLKEIEFEFKTVIEEVPAGPTWKVRPVPTHTWILAGVTLAGFATFATLGIMGNSEKSSLENSCGLTASCTDADMSTMNSLYLGADIALGVAIGSFVATTITYLIRPTVEIPMNLSVIPTSNGVYGSLSLQVF